MSGTIGAILMDFSKAFDSISQDLLIANIEVYGLQRNALKLVYGFLKNRMQRRTLESTYSSVKQILIWIPHGSVLGPLLFKIFINNLLVIEMESDICNFAYDTTMYVCDTSIEAV